MCSAEEIVGDLFAHYAADCRRLPGERAGLVGGLGEEDRPRAIADFIAGMTDRFAIAEHRRLFDATPVLG
jgi:dGTPase